MKNTRGQAFTYNSVQHLLHNRRYIGEYAYRDIVVPDGIPAIVPQDLFDRVQEKLAKPKVSAEFMTFWLHRFRKLDVSQKSHRKMLIDTFVNAIFLYDDRLVITYNYKEGTSTVTLDDVKAAGYNGIAPGSDLDCLAAPALSKGAGAISAGSFLLFKTQPGEAAAF